MSVVLVDTNVPMYAAGTEHPLREPARAAVHAIAQGTLDAVTDAEVFQEILDRFLSIRQREKGFRVFDAFRDLMRGRVLPVEDEDVQWARDLAELHTTLSPRDLIHAAIAERRGIDRILSADASFDRVPSLRRLDLASFVPPS